MTARVAGGLEGPERAVFEATKERAGIVDADLLDFASQVVFAFLDERFGHGVDLVDAAVEPERRVDAMGQQIPGNAAAGHFDVEAPQPGSALGEIFRDSPVLEELRP